MDLWILQHHCLNVMHYRLTPATFQDENATRLLLRKLKRKEAMLQQEMANNELLRKEVG